MKAHARRKSLGPRRAVARQSAIEHLEARTLLTLLGQQLFPADNPWNQNIAGAPVAANSDAIINNIISLAGGDGHLHPDFGQDTHSSKPLYGIPYNVVHGNTQPKVPVVVGAYASESDLEDAPIPANAVLEGDLQNGPTSGLANRGDSHLIVFDVDNDVAYEFFAASRPSENSDGKWHAAQESVWDLKANTFRTIGYTSADAAGLPILPGLTRPDEGLPSDQGGQGAINHALRFTLENNIILDEFLYPAEHVADSNQNAAIEPPMGARFRLKANVDISQLNPQSQIIAQALKTYGMIVADNGGNFFLSGASDAVDANNQDTLTWNDADIQDTAHGLKSIPFSDFEVVDLTPQVSALSAAQGPAGSALTITGQNFSGAAGHLQVLFGNTPATNVTVVDDGHITATAPEGSGTVDVRVQSGATTASDSQNVNNPIFGYGISAVSANDKFTYTSGGGGGTLTPQPTTIAPTEGQTFAGAVASFLNSASGVSGLDNTPASDLTATIDWGDGSSATSGTVAAGANGALVVSGSHVYAEEATGLPVSVTISDLGITASAISTANVADAPLSAAAVTASFASGVASNQVLATFSDAGGALPADNYSAVVDWGDGASGAASVVSGAAGLQVMGSHAYSSAGVFPVTIQIDDPGGATVHVTGQAVVSSPTATSKNQLLVDAAYQSLLGRPVDPGSLNYWMTRLAAGTSRDDLAQTLLQSGEYASASIAAAYQKLLHRLPDAQGLDYWTGRLNSDLTHETLLAGIVASPEYLSQAGTVNSWISSAYLDLISRPADPAGQSYWLNSLSSGVSRYDVARRLLAGHEGQLAQIASAYQQYLGRAVDSNALNYWSDQLAHGSTQNDLVISLIASEEFFGRATKVS